MLSVPKPIIIGKLVLEVLGDCKTKLLLDFFLFVCLFCSNGFSVLDFGMRCLLRHHSCACSSVSRSYFVVGTKTG